MPVDATAHPVQTQCSLWQGYVPPPSEMGTGVPQGAGPVPGTGLGGMPGAGLVGMPGAGFGGAMPSAALGGGGAGTTFLCLENLVQPADLVEDADYSEILEDVQEVARALPMPRP